MLLARCAVKKKIVEMVKVFRVLRISSIIALVCFVGFLMVILYMFAKIIEIRFLSRSDKCIYEEPIDVVYTWVNGSDPIFLKDVQHYLKLRNANVDSSKQRFEDRNELRFSLRSLEVHAPWVNHIYLVTNGQIPYWLDLDHEKLTIITHDQIFKDKNNLPTFSSPAIESNLHRIPGLSNKFIYFNDDIFLGLPVYPEDFSATNRGYLIYLAWPVPQCAPNCPWMYVNDGQCDKACNVLNCQFDGDDCQETESGQIIYAEEINSEEVKQYNKKIENEFEFLKQKVQKIFENKPSELEDHMGKNQNNIADPKNSYKTTLNLSALKNIKTDYNQNNKIASININGSNNLITKIVNEHNLKVLNQNKLLSRKRRSYRGLNLNSFGDKVVNIDGYSESLQHTNRIFNKKYGYKTRRVPAHAPILIQRDIMLNLQEKFPTEFTITEKNRFRQADDMQFSFSYYYFLISEKVHRTAKDVFSDFDTDNSGTWSDREIRNILTKMYELPLSYEIVDSFEAMLLNCSEGRKLSADVRTPPYERYIDSRLPTITKEMVTECPFMSTLLKTKFGPIPKYKYEIVKSSDSKFIYFKMLRSNISDVVIQLDEIRSKMKKFICLNDNLDESKTSENELIRAILYDFYLSLFPHRSKFELPEDSRNRFFYMDELNDWRRNHYQIKLILCLAILVLVLTMFFNVFKRGVCVVFNKLFC